MAAQETYSREDVLPVIFQDQDSELEGKSSNEEASEPNLDSDISEGPNESESSEEEHQCIAAHAWANTPGGHQTTSSPHNHCSN